MSKKFGATIQKSSSRCLHWQLGLAFAVQLFSGSRAHAENHVDYGFEYYKEDNNRMTIETHSVVFEQKLTDAIIAKGELTYDGISGATPTGTVKPSGKINLTQLADIRRAESIELDWRLGSHTLTPGFSHSQESDYISYGVSLNDAVEFNEKNTTLSYGISQNFDSVREANKKTWNPKYSTEALIGISQLLSPRTILNVAFTFGNDSGYLNDPYRLITFAGSGFAYPEIRPSHRNKEALFTSVTHHFESLNASLESSYRFYHDSYGVYANTLGMTWHQWFGKHMLVDPLFRFYEQSAADFYRATVPGYFPSDPIPRPSFYSADYRLSELYTLDFGLQATAVVNDHLHIVAGFHRYEMYGLDGKTSSAMYPKANVYTIGLSILW